MTPIRALRGRHMLVTAGPTREAIDPVRYITNRSSGKMGFAVAQAAAEAGARVTLVAGPVNLETPEGVQRVDIESAAEMHAAVTGRLPGVDIFIAAAAVADYRPLQAHEHKIKKTQDSMHIELVRNPDILASVAAPRDGPFTVGFAAETRDVIAHARDKLERKRVDMIAANRVGRGLAFDQADNELVLLWRDGELRLPRQDKLSLARGLVACVAEKFMQKTQREDKT